MRLHPQYGSITIYPQGIMIMEKNRSENDKKVYLFLGILFLLLLTVFIWAMITTGGFLFKSIAVEGASYKRSFMLPADKISDMSIFDDNALGKTIIQYFKNNPHENKDLIETWSPDNVTVSYEKINHKVVVFYTFPTYSTFYFHLWTFTLYHGGDDCPTLSKKVHSKNYEISQNIEKLLRQLLKSSNSKAGEP